MSSDLMNAISSASTGLRAQSVRIRIAAENVANANSTAQIPGGDPYRRRVPVFDDYLQEETNTIGVKVVGAYPDRSAFPLKYDPTHPAANAAGYVKMPNVKSLIEMADLREAQRAYEANLNIVESSRRMLGSVIDLIRGR